MIALVAALALAAPAPAQDPGVRLAARVPAAARPAVDSIVRAAAADSLPTAPLVEKALEGSAKHALPASIVAAVAATAGRLRDARAVLRSARPGARPSDAAITSVADALGRGLPLAVVRKVAAGAADGDVGPAVHAVADLMLTGVPPDSGTALILAAARQGLHGLRLLDVSAAAEHALQQGATPVQAVAEVRAMLPDVPAPPPPPRRALRGATRPSPGRSR